MNSTELQEFRKRRLREAIDTFFGGNKSALARELKNRLGEPLKDGSYVGHLLLDLSKRQARLIDEDRVREIESLRSGLKGWFAAEVPMTSPTPSSQMAEPTPADGLVSLGKALADADALTRGIVRQILDALCSEPERAEELAARLEHALAAPRSANTGTHGP